jgi:hypothetical protein
LSISSTFSNRLTLDSESIIKMSSSSWRMVALLVAILVITSFFVFSRLGCSALMTIPKHYSSRPDSLTVKLTTVTLVETSGV